MSVLIAYFGVCVAFSVLYCLIGYCASTHDGDEMPVLADGRLDRRLGAYRAAVESRRLQPDIGVAACA